MSSDVLLVRAERVGESVLVEPFGRQVRTLIDGALQLGRRSGRLRQHIVKRFLVLVVRDDRRRTYRCDEVAVAIIRRHE